MKTTPFTWGNATVNSLATARHSRSSSEVETYGLNAVQSIVHAGTPDRVRHRSLRSDRRSSVQPASKTKHGCSRLPRKTHGRGQARWKRKSCEHSQKSARRLWALEFCCRSHFLVAAGPNRTASVVDPLRPIQHGAARQDKRRDAGMTGCIGGTKTPCSADDHLRI